MPPFPKFLISAALAAMPVLSHAQDTEIGQHLLIELNAAQPQDQGCKLSFLVLNGHPADIDQAVFETVVIDAAGQVDRLTLFDFGALPAGRPRVRQFVLTGAGCEDIGQLLFNGASTCTAPDLDARACAADLQLETRTDIEVAG